MTRTLKLQAMFTFSAIIRNLKMSRALVSNPITMSDFSSKRDPVLWTRTLGTITSYYQKPTRASHEHELHGHACQIHKRLKGQN